MNGLVRCLSITTHSGKVIGSSTTEVLTNLKAWGIVYCDNRYIKGKKSMHYGLKGKYTTDIKNAPCRDMEFVKKVLKQKGAP